MPSALSAYSFLKFVLPSLDYSNNLVIGKPFGSQAWYLIWKRLNLIQEKDLKKLSYGVNHNDLDFVDYTEDTLGNSLGIASGLSIGNNKKTYCFLSDASIQMGPTIEAINFIGLSPYSNKNITCFVDCNNFQLTGSTSSVSGFDINTINQIFKNANFKTYIIDCSSDIANKEFFYTFGKDESLPVVYLFLTKKGDGIKEMEDDPVKYHYAKI